METAIDCCPDQKAQKRLNTIHLLLCGGTFELARKHARISERCLQLWISRFNEQGIDGVTYHPRTGRPRKVQTEEVETLILPVVDDPALAGEHHWTITKLSGWLKTEQQLDISYRTLVRYLHEHEYVRKIPRRFPEPKDLTKWEDEREAFAMQLVGLLNDSNARVFSSDEAGFEGDPRPRLKWVKRGSRPEIGYYGGHVRSNVVGAVEPQSGRLVSVIVPYCDRLVFQTFLDILAKEVPKQRGKTNYLILDNASWHKSKSLEWHHFEPLFLPAYSPDFNLIERLWQHLKSNYLTGFITDDYDELDAKIESSIRDLLGGVTSVL